MWFYCNMTRVSMTIWQEWRGGILEVNVQLVDVLSANSLCRFTGSMEFSSLAICVHWHGAEQAFSIRSPWELSDRLMWDWQRCYQWEHQKAEKCSALLKLEKKNKGWQPVAVRRSQCAIRVSKSANSAGVSGVFTAHCCYIEFRFWKIVAAWWTKV